MTTPNSTTEAGVTKSENPTIDWAIRTLRAIADKGRAGLGDSYPEILSVIGGLKNFAQSRASAQGGERVDLPQHFATICDDGHWLLNLRGPHGRNHINAGWPSKKVYTEDQVRAILATPPATSGMKESMAGDAERLDTPGNQYPEARYAGYKGRPISPDCPADERAAWQEGHDARADTAIRAGRKG